jgi:hypothetical protein
MKRAEIRLLAYLLLGMALTACVSSAPRTASPDQSVIDGVAGALQSLQRYLPGSYNNHVQVREQNAEAESGVPHLRLMIEAQANNNRFLVTQTSVNSDSPPRVFLWQFGASEDGRLLMEFAPQINGQTGRACQLELLPTGNAISGSTQAEQCRMPNREGLQLGLMKEYLLAAGRIEIGERLVDLQQQSAIAADTRLRFRRELSYSGWAGRKLESETKWRLATPFNLHNQGDSIALSDQLERPLGYSLQLSQLRYREDQPEILRLALIDDDTRQQVAYAFADSNASQIGLNLGWFQVGLSRQGQTARSQPQQTSD